MTHTEISTHDHVSVERLTTSQSTFPARLTPVIDLRICESELSGSAPTKHTYHYSLYCCGNDRLGENCPSQPTDHSAVNRMMNEDSQLVASSLAMGCSAICGVRQTKFAPTTFTPNLKKKTFWIRHETGNSTARRSLPPLAVGGNQQSDGLQAKVQVAELAHQLHVVLAAHVGVCDSASGPPSSAYATTSKRSVAHLLQ